MDGADLDRARAVKDRARDLYAKHAPVVGVGITRVDGGFGVKINLGTPPPPGSALPESIDGVPVRVEVVGTIRGR